MTAPQIADSDFSLDTVRNSLLNKLIFYTTLFSLSVLPFASIRAHQAGAALQLVLHLVTLAILVLLWVYREKISFHAKGITYISLFFLVGLGGVVTFGLVATGPIGLMAGTLLTFIFFGNRAGLYATGASAISLLLIGILFNQEILSYPFDLETYTKSLAGWGIMLSVFTVFVPIASLGFGSIYNHAAATNSALRESEQMYRDFVERANDCVTIVQDGRMRFANQRIFEIFGYSVEEVLDTPFINYIAPEERARVGAIHQKRHRKQGSPDIYESIAIKKDGCRVPIETNSALITFRGHPATLAVIRDITIRKHTQDLEEQLAQSEKMRAIGQLAGGVAHDFNNQLSGIMGYADMLASQVEDENAKSDARAIVKLAERSAGLTHQLLAFARKSKKVDLPISVNKILHEVNSILERSIDKRITIEEQFSDRNPVIQGDPTLIQNALLNIALNARDAMPDGGKITLETDLVELSDVDCKNSLFAISPGSFVQISISDTGPGIDENIKDQIFEPFFTTKTEGKSLGMGLAAVYGTVRSHSGAIEVTGNEGCGTKFQLIFPLAKDARLEETQTLSSRVKKGSANILVVDDEDYVRDMTAKMLTRLGYEITACADGEEALKIYRDSEKAFDLVILDIVMPKMNGKEAFLALRKLDTEVRVLFVSGYSVTEDNIQDIPYDRFVGFLQKPFLLATLSQKVDEALKKA